MNLKFQVEARIAKPIAEVFDAVYNPKKLSRYFTTGGASGPLEPGVVSWDFADFPGAFPVTVKRSVKNELIAFAWASMEGGYDTEIEIRFEAAGPGTTKVTVAESGWRESQKGLDASYGNCQGWMHMLCALKVWLEHGINLREGFFK